MAAVGHSLGGVILRSALLDGRVAPLVTGASAVMVAPPLRGAAFARTLASSWGGGVVRWVVGDKAGRELCTVRSFRGRWHSRPRRHGPDDGGEDDGGGDDDGGEWVDGVRLLVVSGDVGVGWHPLLAGAGPHDGVVALSETRLEVPHHRWTVPYSHNGMLMRRRVCGRVADFLEGDAVGDLYVPAGAEVADGSMAC